MDTPASAFTSYVDFAQICLYIFFFFFGTLVYYLHRENKREGYPLVSDRTQRAPRVKVVGFPDVPKPKTYLLANGGTATMPHQRNEREGVALEPYAPWPGAPFVPTGNPMLDGVGPAAWANRDDEIEETLDKVPLISPMHAMNDVFVEPRDPDPRGMKVVGADGKVAGTVTELWVDRAEPQVRYLELEVDGAGRTALLPMPYARVSRHRGEVRVKSILARQFADVPRIKSPDRVTKLEEDKIMAYYAGGHLYATPARVGPLF
jgi:photosynthetic reaction center H subunit